MIPVESDFEAADIIIAVCKVFIPAPHDDRDRVREIVRGAAGALLPAAAAVLLLLLFFGGAEARESVNWKDGFDIPYWI